MSALPQNVSPLGLASLLVTGVLTPAVGWLIRNGMRLVRRQTLNEARIRDLRKEVDELNKTQGKHDLRICKVEDAICDFREDCAQRNQQYTTITEKLQQLSRVTALLESFAVAIEKIVPRPEVESRLSQVERRVELVEHDVRREGAK